MRPRLSPRGRDVRTQPAHGLRNGIPQPYQLFDLRRPRGWRGTPAGDAPPMAVVGHMALATPIRSSETIRPCSGKAFSLTCRWGPEGPCATRFACPLEDSSSGALSVTRLSMSGANFDQYWRSRLGFGRYCLFGPDCGKGADARRIGLGGRPSTRPKSKPDERDIVQNERQCSGKIPSSDRPSTTQTMDILWIASGQGV